VLKNLEVDIERTRNEILRELDPNFLRKRRRRRGGSDFDEPVTAAAA
jgi:hypothetical protein